MDRSAISALPKAELHCHLDGVLDPAMLRALLDEGLDLPLTPEVLEAGYPVHDFDSFIAWFATQGSLAGSFDFYGHVARQHITRLRAQHVVYAELFVASISHDVEQAMDQLAGLREMVDRGEGGDIQVELLNAWRRNRDMASIERIADRNIRLFEAGMLHGIALAGPEQGFPVAPLAHVFDRYHEAGVPIEIHAGEWWGAESIWDALEHGHPRRIGHGTHLLEDPRLVDTLIERGIHVEMCPTSNLCTGSTHSLEEHPIRRAFDAGLDVSIATDDPGAFLCSMDSEYTLLAERFGFTDQELVRLGANAVRARFQPQLRVPAAQALARA
jgi:adenosine deaminase